jgi:glycosyltransferase involved in cell wall biosynthesis
MKIAIDARIINSSTGRYVERLLYYLQDIDSENEYIVLVRKKDKDFWKPKQKNFSVKVAEYDNYSFNEQVGFWRFLTKLKPDLVHFCMPQQPIFYRGAKVTTIHDLTLLNTYNSDKNWLIFHFKQFVGRFVFRSIGRTSNQIIVPTEYTRRAYLAFSGIDEGNVTLSYEAADIPDLPPAPYPTLENKDYLLYVGSQSDYKNARRLIQAHQLLLKTNPALQLVFAGSLTGKNGRASAKNKQWVEHSGFHNITFTGFVPDEQLAWLYTHSTAYVFPSLMEGFGLPGLEAMLYGAPVVSSNATCLPEVYGDAAEYFDPTDETAIAEAIERVITNPARQEELKLRGYERAKKYSWKRMAQETYDVYMRVLGVSTSSSEQ